MPLNTIKQYATPSSSNRLASAEPQSTLEIPILVVDNASIRSAPTPSQPEPELDTQQSQTPPPISDNTSTRFPIDWPALRYNHQPLVGQVGWRIRNKRQQGGESKFSPIWLHGADLLWIPPGQLGKRLFLCERCHLARQHTQAIFMYNGTAHILLHLRKVHRIGADGLELAPELLTRRSPWDSPSES